MAGKLMVIQRPDTCVSCAQTLPPKTCAWWDSTERTVTCTACRPTGMVLPRPGPTTLPRPALAIPRPARTTFPPPAPIDHGTGSVAVQPEHDRRVTTLRRQPGVIFGEQVLGDIGVQLPDDPVPSTSWAEGPEVVDGERGLAAFLDREVGHAAIVLHDRRVSTSKGNIEHLVVASTGVWLIDSKDYAGKVEGRNVGERHEPELRLFVAHRNQTKLVEAMTERVKAVERALDTTRIASVPIQGCLCFTGADWRFRSKPFLIDGIWIGWPQVLIKTLRATPVLERSTVATLADHLGTRFPAAN